METKHCCNCNGKSVAVGRSTSRNNNSNSNSNSDTMSPPLALSPSATRKQVMDRFMAPTCLLLLISVLVFACLVHLVHAGQETPGEPQLEIHDIFKPEQCDRKARSTDVLTLHYKGFIQGSDSVFDSSYERNEPFTFQLGIGQVIRGWEKGLVGVCVGEKRKLVIPPQLGYGSAKHDQIPPDSTLIFDVEILKLEEGPKPMLNVFKEIDVDADGRLSRKEVGEFLKKQLNQASQHGDAGSADDPDQAQMVDEIFMHEDRDKDGYITHDEFSGPKYDHDEL